jgi:thymidylate synthase
MLFTSTKVLDIRQQFIDLYTSGKGIVPDKNGTQVIEIINTSFIADEPTIFGTANDEWHNRELAWYLSESLNVNDIPPPIPKIWQQIADEDGFINSNYGNLIFSDNNGNQYQHVLNKLKSDQASRQAIMIYNRPSMHVEWNLIGRSDFICCQNTQHFIRDNGLISIANFRSSDAIFGYKGDKFWIDFVHSKLYNDLLDTYPNLKLGTVIWNAMSLHVYSRHFHLIEKVAKETKLPQNNTEKAITGAQAPIQALWDDFPAFCSVSSDSLPELTQEQLENGMTSVMDFIAKRKAHNNEL